MQSSPEWELLMYMDKCIVIISIPLTKDGIQYSFSPFYKDNRKNIGIKIYIGVSANQN